MKNRILKVAENIYEWLGTKTFFVVSLVYFLGNSIWLILSSNLLPYDEYYHLAIIKQYALQWSPFITMQPIEGVYYGDITRLHSYLYHYLMSFPYRFFDYFLESEMVIIILLRILNVAMVVGGIVLFRRLFLRAGLSRRLVGVVSLIFMATPFVVVLASQNNYDNLMFLLSPIFFSFAYNIIKKKQLNIVDVVMYATLGLLISLVKHAFTLYFLITSLYLASSLFGRRKILITDIKKSIASTPTKVLVLVMLGSLLVTGLFLERHGINLIKYGAINVDCVKVQSESVCNNYSPWQRNNYIKSHKPAIPLYSNIFSFTQHWVSTMLRGGYAIFTHIIPSDLNQPNPYGHYVFMPLLWLPINIAGVMSVLSAAAIYKKRKYILQNKLLSMFLIIAFAVLISVFIFNYRTYLNLGKAYAIQIRYLLPILLPIILICAFAVGALVSSWKYRKVILAVVLISYTVNGGIVGWLIRSEANWYWPGQTITTINQGTQEILKKIIPN